jgi:hypothetical protein
VRKQPEPARVAPLGDPIYERIVRTLAEIDRNMHTDPFGPDGVFGEQRSMDLNPRMLLAWHRVRAKELARHNS